MKTLLLNVKVVLIQLEKILKGKIMNDKKKKKPNFELKWISLSIVNDFVLPNAMEFIHNGNVPE